MNKFMFATLTVTVTLLNSVATSAETLIQEVNQTINLAQEFELEQSIDLRRAQNLARQAAENANGGLGEYRAESSMHGPVEVSPYVENADGSWTFTFKGRRPYSSNYSVESVITVTPTGNVNIDYNGRIRQTGQQTQPLRDNTATPNIDLKRAQNLARQAAENANGGLGEYRAESSMHGPTIDAPYVVNADGSWTFTFKGRRPSASTYSLESVVTITPNGDVRVDYNGNFR